ncbi:hypothetical protein [Halorubrum tailed virus BLv36]|nr:hypothetical protein [Halorubrum tailed virus BLv36]
MKAEHVLSASYEWGEEPLNINKIDGLQEAVERVRETKEKELVRCEDRVCDYDVYWNRKTNAVRIAAVAMGASYEVTNDTDLTDYETE